MCRHAAQPPSIQWKRCAQNKYSMQRKAEWKPYSTYLIDSGYAPRGRFWQTYCAMRAAVSSKTFLGKGETNGNARKSAWETNRRTRRWDLAGDALCVCREGWTVSEHCAPSLAGSAYGYS